MRFFVAFALLLSLTLAGFLAGASAQTQVTCTPSLCELRLERVLQTNDWGATFMNDTIGITTTGPVTYLDLGVPLAVTDKIGFLSATDINGTLLRTVRLSANQTGGYLPVRVELPRKTGAYSISLRTVFGGLLSFDSTSKKYTFAFSPFPVVDSTVRISSAGLTVRTGDWSDVTSTGIKGTVSASGKTFNATTSNLGPYNTTLGKLVFTSGTQNALDVTAARQITISSSGKAQVADKYNVTNKGRDVSSLTFLLPKGTNNIGGSDVVGPLDTTKIVVAAQSNGTNLVTFVPRFNTIKNEGGANLKLEYELDSNTYVTTSSLGRYSLNLRMLDNVRFVQPSLQTRIVVPAGFKLESVSGRAALVTNDGIVLEASEVTPLSDLSFSLSYRLDPFWASLTALAWAGLLEAGLAAAVLVYVSGSTRAAAIGLAPPGIISRFVDLSDEKATLRLESEKLEEDMVRGAVGRHDFRRRRRTIDLRTGEIDRLLGPVKQEVSALSARYSDLVRRLERAEAEMQVVRGSITDLRNQYRSGRMARELFESMNSELVRRKERAQQTMDNIFIGLREEAR